MKQHTFIIPNNTTSKQMHFEENTFHVPLGDEIQSQHTSHVKQYHINTEVLR